MAAVLLHVSAGYQQIIQIDEGDWQVEEKPVHESLECRPHILQTERHPQELKEAKRSYYQCCGAGAARSRIFWSEPEPEP
jgi:hypothetical protein